MIEHKILHNYAFYTFGLSGLTKKVFVSIFKVSIFWMSVFCHRALMDKKRLSRAKRMAAGREITKSGWPQR